MGILITHDQEVAAQRRRAWAFLAGALLAALAVSLLLAARQGYFKQTVPFYFVADSASEITRGMPVKAVGFRIGSVGQVELQPDASVKVRMDIDSEYTRFITYDAVAQLRKEGLVGGGMIELESGDNKEMLAAPQSILKFERNPSLSELAQQLHDEIGPIIQDIKQITGTLADKDGGIKHTLTLVNQTVASLHASSEQLQTLVHHGDEQVVKLGGKAAATLDRAENDLAQLGHSLQRLDAKLPPLLDKVDGILGDAGKLSREAAAQGPALLRDGSAAVADTREILDGAKNAWPLRNLLAPAASGNLAPDSYAPAAAVQR